MYHTHDAREVPGSCLGRAVTHTATVSSLLFPVREGDCDDDFDANDDTSALYDHHDVPHRGHKVWQHEPCWIAASRAMLLDHPARVLCSIPRLAVGLLQVERNLFAGPSF